MDQRLADRRHFSDHSCSQINEVSGNGADLNRKRKLLHEHTESESPISKQKLGNQQATELTDSSHNSVNSPAAINNAQYPYMDSDWYYTSSSSCSNEGTSTSSTFGSSIEFEGDGDGDGDTDNGGAQYGCKKELLFKEIEALHDPVITALAKSRLGVSEDPDGDTLDSMVCSNDSGEFRANSGLGGAMQDGRAVSRTLTIDQEFEQYFSQLML